MNSRLFFAMLLLPILAGAQNLVMNGNFKMGTMGFAQRRWLRFDTNPKQQYIPLETVELPDGGHALKIESPYEERSLVSARQFELKGGVKYTMRVKMRSTAPVSVSFNVYCMNNNYNRFSSPRYQVDTKWKEYVWHFNTKSKSLKGFFYHLNMSIVKLKGDMYIRDLELFENGTGAENGLQFAADVKEPVLETTQKTLEWSVPVYAWNGTEKPFKGNVTVTAQDQFFPEKSHKVQIPVELAPGESKVFTAKFTTDYGCYEISEKCSESSRFVPAYQAVIGKYTAKKLDFDKDFCIGINAGLDIVKNTSIPELSTLVLNAGPEKKFEFFAKMGCRLIRDIATDVDPTIWSLMEVKPGEWDYRHLDHSLNLYRKYNIELLACVGRMYCAGRHMSKHRKSYQLPGFPQWVYDASTPVKIAPYNWASTAGRNDVPPIEMWRAYVKHLTAHAKGRIKFYEIFNEPNGYLPAEVYFPYLKAFYEEAKKNDPDCRIVGLCVTSDFGTVGDQFTTDMMKLGAGKYMDIVSFHPYSGRELNSINPADQYIANFRKCLGPEYEKTMPVWNTELMYLYDNDRNIRGSEHDLNPARVTARTMVDLGEGVQQATSVYQYPLIQKRIFAADWYHGVNCEILPSSTYVAFNAMARFLEAAKPVKKIFFDSGAVAYIYRKDGKLLAGFWNYKRKPQVKADLSMFDLYDVYGNPIPAAKDMPVTDTPYYLKQGKLSSNDFMNAVSNLKFNKVNPIEIQPHARIAESNGRQTLYATLINETNKEQQVAAGFSGNGLTAGKTVTARIPAKGKCVIEIPLKESKTASGEPTLSVYAEGELIRTKLKLHKNPMIHAGSPVTLEIDDLKCTWDIVKRGDDIVLNIKVADKTDSGDPAGREMWQQDCIELFFDNDPLEMVGPHGTIYTPETFRMFVLPRLSGEKQFVSWIKPDSRFKASDLKCSSKTTPDGYEAEITISNGNIADVIGLDINVSDALPGKKAHRSVRWSPRKKSHEYRSDFNLIRFSQKEAVKPVSGAADLNWNGRTPWKKTENGDFTIDYQNNGWPRLTSKQQVKAGKIYKVTFDCKREGDQAPKMSLQANDGGKNFGSSVCTFNTWATQCAYFPAEKDGTMSVIWSFNPHAAAKLTVKNGKFEEVTPEMMKQNLIPNGDFEDVSAKGPAFWKSTNWKESAFPGTIVAGADFLSGEKSLELPFGSGIKSNYLPIQKGKKYQLSFWAKGSGDSVIKVSFGVWNMRGHKGKHFARGQNFKLGKDWKEYKFMVEIPTDDAKFPDVNAGTGNISFSVKDSNGKYYLDDISFCEKK